VIILPPLERWLARAFGDVEGTHFGSGWISGTASVFLGALALLGVLGFWFPGALTTAVFRAHYPIPLLRALVNVTIGLAFLLGAVSLVLRRRKVLGLTGLGTPTSASASGGSIGSSPRRAPTTGTMRSRRSTRTSRCTCRYSTCCSGRSTCRMASGRPPTESRATWFPRAGARSWCTRFVATASC
jgi:hypothetical protein